MNDFWEAFETCILMAILAGTRDTRPDGWWFVWGGSVPFTKDWQPGLWE